MDLSELTAISPIDGRYGSKTTELREIFSEFGLMSFRVLIEIHWLRWLSMEDGIKEIPAFSKQALKELESIVENFSLEDAQQIKEIERQTNHDVKAIEYFIKQKIASNPELTACGEFIHFSCTSEDINNLSYALMLQASKEEHLLPYLDDILAFLTKLAHQYADQAMLSRTHGQSATPTTMGKEMANHAARLKRQIDILRRVEICGKFNGAVGNYNAHYAAYPEVDWLQISQQFVHSLGLEWAEYTTQIEPHDYIAEYMHAFVRIHNILIDLSRDIWGYIALGYFQQKSVGHEVGSSTMPHKVNPIDFENAEGNLSMANAIAECLADRLPISRWQRDLVDSTLLRNLGVVFAHSLVAYKSLLKGLKKLELNHSKLKADLDDNWQILAEPIQTIMRRYGIEQPYEKLKTFTRGKKIDKKAIHDFIDSLDLPAAVITQLKELSPGDYIGKATQLAMEV